MSGEDQVFEYRLGYRYVVVGWAGLVLFPLLGIGLVLGQCPPARPEAPRWMRLLFVYAIPGAFTLMSAYLEMIRRSRTGSIPMERPARWRWQREFLQCRGF